MNIWYKTVVYSMSFRMKNRFEYKLRRKDGNKVFRNVYLISFVVGGNDL